MGGSDRRHVGCGGRQRAFGARPGTFALAPHRLASPARVFGASRAWYTSCCWLDRWRSLGACGNAVWTIVAKTHHQPSSVKCLARRPLGRSVADRRGPLRFTRSPVPWFPARYRPWPVCRDMEAAQSYAATFEVADRLDAQKLCELKPLTEI